MADPETGTPEARRRLVVAALVEADGERRVALVPDSVARLAALGIEVLLETGAGAAAAFPDEAYRAAGARVLDEAAVFAEADVVVSVGGLPERRRRLLRAGQVLVGVLRPLVEPEVVAELAATGATLVSLDLLPRRLSRAQAMDVLTSQANVAGYKAAVLAADTFARFFPMLVTAAGTARPAEVLVLGAGVAGLQAMGTARRLGAMVTGYDVRPETRAEIASVGARVLELAALASGSGEGGYARALTPEEQAAQQEALDAQVARFDVVITTAQVPGRRPPVLVTAAAVAAMRPGSVVVDLAASDLGGNVEGSAPGTTTETPNGVVVIGAGDLASRVATAASTAYSNNLTAVLRSIVQDGTVVLDPDDEVHAGVLVARDGEIVHPAVRPLVRPAPSEEVHP